ncbi:MAG: radical SAM protein [Planctomycetales bacterium 12-60-4]|nr:MAG: radical SAM protein [Planctomycetales bacterium 12-60-4]
MSSVNDSISLFDAAGLEELRRELRLDPLATRRLRNSLLRKFDRDEQALAPFPARNVLSLHSLVMAEQVESQEDGATKLLFRTSDGLPLETVLLRPQTGRATVCISSQVGCAAACAFCATGHMGIARNLTVEQILDQVLQAGQRFALEGRRLRNVVFMGMGEPFHNEAAVVTAIKRLIDPTWFGLSPRKICVSTVGLPEAILRCAERFPTVRLALSLHSARQEVREGLIPLAKRHPLDELRRTVAEVNRITSSAVMIEYLLLAGVNDTADDIATLIDWLTGLDVHVNLIPYNPIAAAPHLKGSTPDIQQACARILKQAGFKTTVRYSLGNDIAAACGQLVRREARPASAHGRSQFPEHI